MIDKVARRLRKISSRVLFAADRGERGLISHASRSQFDTVSVESFDAWKVRAEHRETVRSTLADAGFWYATLPGFGGDPLRIAVRESDREHILQALRADSSLARYYATRLDGSQSVGVPIRVSKLGLGRGGRASRPATLRIFRYLCGPGRIPLSAGNLGCDLEFWPEATTADTPRADGGCFALGSLLAPRQNPWTNALSPELVAELGQDRGHRTADQGWVNWPRPRADSRLHPWAEIGFPVDVVYTWVDGDDPRWQHERDLALGEGEGRSTELNSSSTDTSRFISRDELKYSLRSLAMYAGWVRQIYIVTNGQIPDWLDADHPQITLVRHSEIFPDSADLPTFNSHAIEANLHRIEGLSEHYLYFNDDVFVARPIRGERFFHANGISKFFPSGVSVDDDPPSARDLPIATAFKNARRLLEAEFGWTPTFKMRHTPHALKRSAAQTLEERHPEIFAATSAAKFRSPADYSIPSMLQSLWGFGEGTAVPDGISYAFVDLSEPSLERELERLRRIRRLDTFCLNETTQQDGAAALETSRRLALFLEEVFPVPSPFEKNWTLGQG